MEPLAQAGSQLEWAGQTWLHPLGMAAVIVFGLLLLCLPRPHAMLPVILMACFVAPAQRVVVFTLDFNLLRILVLCGLLRVVLRGEMYGIRWRTIDLLVIAGAAAGTIGYTIQLASLSAFVNRLGAGVDLVGLYLLCRVLLRSPTDIHQVAVWVSAIAVPVLGAFAVEHATGRNLFAFLGGVPAETVVRNGRMRCQGAFPHPILAGVFWASLLPLAGALWWSDRRDRWLAPVGVIAMLGLVGLSASSTPVSAVGFAALGGAAFCVRRFVPYIAVAAIPLLVVLHFTMNKPVWHLLARIDFAGGSTGYHRFHLIDAAIQHFDEWWLIGVHSTGHWGYGLQDVTNQYVLEGVRGGVLPLILLLASIGCAWAMTGRSVRAAATRDTMILAWALGVMVFVHVVCFIGVSYSGQAVLVWGMALAAVASLNDWLCEPAQYLPHSSPGAAPVASGQGWCASVR